MTNAALIQVDGGSFLQTLGGMNGLIASDSSLNKIEVNNGGQFIVDNGNAGLLAIEARFENNGGRVEFRGAGGVTYREVGANSGLYYQTQASSVTIFGGAVYDMGLLRVLGGSLNLEGGAISISRATISQFNNATFEGYGSISYIRANNSTLRLTGDLLTTSRFDAENGTNTFLQGFTLNCRGTGTNTGATIHLQGGSIQGQVTGGSILDD